MPTTTTVGTVSARSPAVTSSLPIAAPHPARAAKLLTISSTKSTCDRRAFGPRAMYCAKRTPAEVRGIGIGTAVIALVANGANGRA